MPLKLVTQANLTDCGLACIAIVAGKSLETVLRVAIKECGYPKDGPHTTSDENLFKLLDHFGIKYGKKQKVRTVDALPPVAILETRKMPSTGNSHLVVFERTPDGDEHALDPGWWLKQQVRRDWNRIKLDTFIPINFDNEVKPKKAAKANSKTAIKIAATEANIEPETLTKSKKPRKPKKTTVESRSTAPTIAIETLSEQQDVVIVDDITGDALSGEWADTAPVTNGTSIRTADEEADHES